MATYILKRKTYSHIRFKEKDYSNEVLNEIKSAGQNALDFTKNKIVKPIASMGKNIWNTAKNTAKDTVKGITGGAVDLASRATNAVGNLSQKTGNFVQGASTFLGSLGGPIGGILGGIGGTLAKIPFSLFGKGVNAAANAGENVANRIKA